MATKTLQVHKESVAEDRLIYGGLLGVSIIVLVELLGKERLDTPLSVCLYCLAISIPLMALALLIRHIDLTHQYKVDPWYINYPLFVAPFVAFTALAGFFWHFSWIAGSLFIVVALYSMGAWLVYDGAVKGINKAPTS